MQGLPKCLEPIASYLVPKEALSPLRPPPVIYFLLDAPERSDGRREEEVLVYIGQSVNVAGRIGGHGDKEFQRVVCLPVSEREIDLIEVALIRYFNPIRNRDLKYPEQVDEIRQILEKLGLESGQVRRRPEDHELRDFSPEMVDAFWTKISRRMRCSLAAVALTGRYPSAAADREGLEVALKTVGLMKHAARTRFIARAPIQVGGVVRNRTYSMVPDVARAVRKVYRKRGLAG
jgi:hypothetical protein